MGEGRARTQRSGAAGRVLGEAVPSGPPSCLEDQLTAVAQGDQNAYEAVYAALAGPVYGVALRVLRDPTHAEEIAQEVLLTVWREATRFDPSRGTAVAWVMTIAHRRAVDRVRSEQSATDRLRRAAPFAAEIPYDSVADTVEVRLKQEAVRRCLEVLSPLQLESVVLAYYGGYTYPEVAEILGLPNGTVKSRIRDGLIRLRDCVGSA